ncbi:MAG: hypothetical protein J6A63_00275 [Clostridia bacterium]|nr:hypothetical protein [Clostridia bacterium]
MTFIKKMKSVLIFLCSALFCLCAGMALSLTPVRVNADTISSFVMVDGASVRMSTPTGIRYSATIDAAEYEALIAKNATFCMVVMPYDYVEDYAAPIDEDTLFNDDFYWWQGKSAAMADDGSQVEVVHFETNSLGEVREDGKYWFQCALTNLKASNHHREFIARAYVKVTENGATTYTFTPENETNIRSVAYVSGRALAEETTALDDTQSAILNRFATQFIQNDGTVELEGNFGTITSVLVDGVAIEGATGATFAYAKTGRHTATITNDENETFTVPFVVADVIIRKASDWVWTGNETNKYFVVANDIDCAGAKLPETTSTLTGGTFDGYGHIVSNAKATHSPFTTQWMGMTVMDLAMVDLSFTDAYNNYIFGTMFSGTVRNCFFSVKTPGDASTMKGSVGLISLNIRGSAENTIIVDKTGLNGLDVSTTKNVAAIGALYQATTAEKLNNVLCVTNGVPVLFKADGTNYSDYTSSCAGVTKLAGNSVDAIKAENLQAFMAKAAETESSRWTLKASNNELRLMGNLIYKAVKSETLDAQFVEVNESGTVSLAFGKAAKDVTVGGVTVSFTQSANAITFNYATTGRQSAVITTMDGDVYTIPFVLADIVIRDVEDLSLKDQYGIVAEDSKYIVIANDIDCNGNTIKPLGVNLNGTIDGYGHVISDAFAINALFTTTWYKGTIMDLAVINLTLGYSTGTQPANTGGLVGTLSGTVKNCIVTGTAKGTTNAGLIAFSNISGTVENTIVIDNKALTGAKHSALGNTTTAKSANFKNVVAVTDGNALWDTTTSAEGDLTNSFTGVKKFATANTAAALASMNGVGDWTYNSETGELSLMGNVVFTVSLNNN